MVDVVVDFMWQLPHSVIISKARTTSNYNIVLSGRRECGESAPRRCIRLLGWCGDISNDMSKSKLFGHLESVSEVMQACVEFVAQLLVVYKRFVQCCNVRVSRRPMRIILTKVEV